MDEKEAAPKPKKKGGKRVRLVTRPKNLKPALDALHRDGVTQFAFVGDDSELASLRYPVLA